MLLKLLVCGADKISVSVILQEGLYCTIIKTHIDLKKYAAAVMHLFSPQFGMHLRNIPLPTALTMRHIFYGVIIGVSLSLTSTSLALYYERRKRERRIEHFEPRPIELRSDEVLEGVTGMIGSCIFMYARMFVYPLSLT